MSDFIGTPDYFGNKVHTAQGLYKSTVNEIYPTTSEYEDLYILENRSGKIDTLSVDFYNFYYSSTIELEVYLDDALFAALSIAFLTKNQLYEYNRRNCRVEVNIPFLNSITLVIEKHATFNAKILAKARISAGSSRTITARLGYYDYTGI